MNQQNEVLAYLKKGNSITPLEALQMFGTFRLSAIIFNIRALGYEVDTEIVRAGKKHWAKYSLVKKGQMTFA